MNEQLVVDELTFEVSRSARRSTVELIVDRGGELRIKAPPRAGAERLAQFVRDNRFWLYTKLAEKESRRHPVTARTFLSGEGFSYLGRNYRLLLVDSQDVPLKLAGGRFRMRRDAASQGRRHFVRWYSDRATVWLTQRVQQWASRMSAKPTALRVQDLGYRWGSCSKNGVVNFHWATILLPPSVIDYVIVHELSHLSDPTHGAAFWSHVARSLPDYKASHTWMTDHAMGIVNL
jgi:predicted metal-dependent hydrolase